MINLIALELALGHLEDAAEHLTVLREELGKLADQPGTNPQRLQLARRRLTELDLQKLILEGNYAEAGTVYEGLAGGSVGNFPPAAVDLTRPDMRGFDPTKFDERPYLLLGASWPAFAMFATTDTTFGLLPRYFGGMIQSVRHSIYQDVYRQMRQDSEFFYRRGFLSLLEGDIESAKKRFQSCDRPPPEGWNTPHVTHRGAEAFLKQIETARKPR